MEPLAYRMRPNTIDDIIGQAHLVGPRGIIRRMVESKRLSSMILYGPPGIGKTSIAQAIAGSTNVKFRQLNAVTNTKKDMQLIAEEAKMSGQVILLLDEIHRLDKGKQDFLLPHLEKGSIILIGATTSNPYHAINPAIRSRTQIFELYPHGDKEVKQALTRALNDDVNGYGKKMFKLMMMQFPTLSKVLPGISELHSMHWNFQFYLHRMTLFILLYRMRKIVCRNRVLISMQMGICITI